MLQTRSILNIADNTGAKKGRLIGIPMKGNRSYAYLGEVITISVQDVLPHNEIKKGDIVYAVIVRTRKEFRRLDGSYIRFDDNACAILQSRTIKEPKGTRIFGPVSKEIKDLGFKKIEKVPQGGIVDVPRPLDISKVMLICPKCNKPSKIGIKRENKKKSRICKNCKSVI